jgi:methionine-rich copper-binding protein CopC
MTRTALRSFPLLVAALLLPLRTAEAHPRLVSAIPAATSKVETAPRELSLTFNEGISVALSRITLVAADGTTIALDSLRASADDPKTLVVRVKGAVAVGRYTVKWQVAGADSHPVRGEFAFEVVTPRAPAAPTGAPSTLR